MISAIASVTTDRDEYSKYYRTGPNGNFSLIQVTIVATGSNGDLLYVALRRIDTGRIVANKTATLQSGSATATISLLNDCNDANGIFRARQGMYEVVASSLPSQAGIVSVSAPISIMIATAAEMREVWLRSIPLELEYRLVASISGMAGVTGAVTRDVQRGGYPLVWDATLRTLSWDNGPTVSVPGSGATVSLTLWNETLDQTVIVRATPAAMPGTTTTGYVFVDYDTIDDNALRQYVRMGYTHLEGLVNTALEPIDAITSLLKSGYPLAEQTFDAPTYRPNKAVRRGLRINLPFRRLLAIHELSGWQAGTKILTVPSNMVVVDARNGSIEIVPPLSGAYPAPMIYGGGTVYAYGMPFGYVNAVVPQFWQFAATYGIDSLEDSNEATVREAVMRYAAIEALLQAGRAAGGVTANESLSRDGASLSRSFTSGQFGVYSDLITGHIQWFQTNVPGLHFAIVGKEVSVA